MSSKDQPRPPFAGIDVLQRAASIIAGGPLQGHWSEHGKWCVFCAIAQAKSEIDSEKGTGATLLECYTSIVGRVFGKPFVVIDSDQPLVEARRAIVLVMDKSESEFTQTRCLEILHAAATQLAEQSPESAMTGPGSLARAEDCFRYPEVGSPLYERLRVPDTHDFRDYPQRDRPDWDLDACGNPLRPGS